jgi:hypothetical protein
MVRTSVDLVLLVCLLIEREKGLFLAEGQSGRKQEREGGREGGKVGLMTIFTQSLLTLPVYGKAWEKLYTLIFY